MAVFERAYPGRVIGIGQDPKVEIDRFAHEHRMPIPSIEDTPPYRISDAYDVVSVPTLFLVEDSRVIETVGAWDRSGFNRVAQRIADLTGAPAVEVSKPEDGLPDFKPG